MFNSVFTSGIDAGMLFLALGVALVSGIVYAYLVSLRLRASKGLFITIALMPTVVALSFAILNVLTASTTTSAITSVGVAMIALGLIRFRSVNAKAEEMLVLLLATAAGAVFGLGFLAIGGIALVVMALIYDGLTMLPIFNNKRFAREKLLKITIPESLEYKDVFNEVFAHYLKEHEIVEVKTTGMGSMYRLSFRVVLKDPNEEKELIDELRTKNGNLEISVLPYVEPKGQI